MNKIVNADEQGRGEGGGGLRKKIIPSLTLLLIIAVSVVIFYFYQRYPDMVEGLKGYFYLAPFLISLIFNATVILPAGSILTVSAFGAVLPSATLVGLAGGAGAAIGEITGYMVGYSGRSIVENMKLYVRLEYWVKKWGFIAIFVLSLVPFVFDLAGIAAGVLRFPLWKFILACWLGRTILYITAAFAGLWGWETILRYLG